jgi:type II secretory pathway component PulC
MMGRLLCLAVGLLVLAGCSPRPERREPVAPTLVTDDDEEAAAAAVIHRDRYEEVCREGLQKVMAWFFLKPHYSNGKFLGYELADIYNEELQDGLLKRGDVILSVNDRSVERPEQAMTVWRELWGRNSLKIKLMRQGKVKVFDIPIVGGTSSL